MPLQPLLAVHEVAFVLDQVSVELAPDAMLAGVAVKVTVGVPEATALTVTESVPVAVLYTELLALSGV